MPAVLAPIEESPWFPADECGRFRVREIDTHFGLTRFARRSEDLLRFFADQLSLQAQYAAEIHSSHAETRLLLRDVHSAADSLSGLSSTMPLELQPLRENLAAQLQNLANGLAQCNGDLERNSRANRPQLAPAALEALLEAEKRLKCGLDRRGAERDAEFDISLNLYLTVTDATGGAGDSAAWFEIGWLQWNHKCDLPMAEEAFSIAADLTAQTTN